MEHEATSRRLLAVAVAGALALAVVPAATAHANVSPPVAVAKQGQLYTLAVPTEEENDFTTQVELTPPVGFSIDSFGPAPGWKRTVKSTGSGEDAVIQKVTWTGGRVPTGDDAFFQFLGRTDAAKSYAFAVRQVYSSGKVVDWTGPESSDTPAPVVEAKSSLGGGGSSTLSIVAIALGGLALVVGVVAILMASGRRSLA